MFSSLMDCIIPRLYFLSVLYDNGVKSHCYAHSNFELYAPSGYLAMSLISSFRANQKAVIQDALSSESLGIRSSKIILIETALSSEELDLRRTK